MDAATFAAIGMNEKFKPAPSDFSRAQRLVPFGNAFPVQQLINTGRQHGGTIFDWPSE
jgi:hypothetical protein